MKRLGILECGPSFTIVRTPVNAGIRTRTYDKRTNRLWDLFSALRMVRALCNRFLLTSAPAPVAAELEEAQGEYTAGLNE